MPKSNNPKKVRVHIYDRLGRNKVGIIRGSEFVGIQVQHTIDDFSSCKINFTSTGAFENVSISPSFNIYVEDEDGRIIFGGVVIGYDVEANSGVIRCYGHRWLLSRLLIDNDKTVSPTDDILDTVEEYIDLAKSKRNIPIIFDREGSAINPAFNTSLRFSAGDDIASALRKIIESIYARWAVRYEKVGNEIIGKLIVRSVRGVTPEGVGIGRLFTKSEDGDVVTLYYGEGDNKNNIQNFNFTVDTPQYTSRTKIAVRINGETQIIDVPPALGSFSAALEFNYGRAEGFMSDYKANSAESAKTIGEINQTYPRTDIDVVLSPKYKKFLNAGDRVWVQIKTELLDVLSDGISARIDGITYDIQDGFIERQLYLNFLNPQKRTGTSGILQDINQSQYRLDGLDKDYLDN